MNDHDKMYQDMATVAFEESGEPENERSLRLQITGIISGVGDEVYPGRCILAAKKIVALVRKHDLQKNAGAPTKDL